MTNGATATATQSAAAIALPAPQADTAASGIARTVVHVAWMTIAVGVGLELILLAIAAGYGTFSKYQPFAADLVQKITWASVVCVGLALGNAASKFRAHLAGVFGLLAAPLGFTMARALHKSTEKALGLASAAAAGPSPLFLASVKAFEYAALGLAIAWLSKRGQGLLAYITAGLGVAIAFGGIILGAMDWHSPKALAGAPLLAKGVNELLFPVCCSVVLFAAENLARKAALLSTIAAPARPEPPAVGSAD